MKAREVAERQKVKFASGDNDTVYTCTGHADWNESHILFYKKAGPGARPEPVWISVDDEMELVENGS